MSLGSIYRPGAGEARSPLVENYCLFKFPTIIYFAALGELLFCILPAEAGVLELQDTTVTEFAFLCIFHIFYSEHALLL